MEPPINPTSRWRKLVILTLKKLIFFWVLWTIYFNFMR